MYKKVWKMNWTKNELRWHKNESKIKKEITKMRLKKKDTIVKKCSKVIKIFQICFCWVPHLMIKRFDTWNCFLLSISCCLDKRTPLSSLFVGWFWLNFDADRSGKLYFNTWNMIYVHWKLFFEKCTFFEKKIAFSK